MLLSSSHPAQVELRLLCGKRFGVPEMPAKRNPGLREVGVRASVQEDHVLHFPLYRRINPNMKSGYQIRCYPDLSSPIWKPVILPESSDFEDCY